MLPRIQETESINIYPGFQRSKVAEASSSVTADRSSKSELVVPETTSSAPPPVDPESGMQEYGQLKQELFWITLLLTGLIFTSVWFLYSLNVALNYLLGACTGLVYLRMLARDVDRLSLENRSLSKTRFAVFIGTLVVASQVDRLQILPIFLGFLTYKATLIVYTVRLTLLTRS